MRKVPPSAPTRPWRRDYSRWRFATLSAVYLLFALHIIHWRLAGRTLAPLELNEVMYTLELGSVSKLRFSPIVLHDDMEVGAHETTRAHG
jgi:hypothetical protein